ncbi:hypothetical protein [Paludisphaera borealis]|uniref:hypothetical protein n=1 Tax=Paludisphaera borealis TaxID=1387353 RepID=UPI0011AB6719|nr:hypothetical protein [Paludisphaera borealis]
MAGMSTLFVMSLFGWFMATFGMWAIAAIAAVGIAWGIKGKQAAIGVGIVLGAALLCMQSLQANKWGRPTLTAKQKKAAADAKKHVVSRKINAQAEKQIDAFIGNGLASMGSGGGYGGIGGGGGSGMGMPQVSVPHVATPNLSPHLPPRAVGIPGPVQHSASFGSPVAAPAATPRAVMGSPTPQIALPGSVTGDTDAARETGLSLIEAAKAKATAATKPQADAKTATASTATATPAAKAAVGNVAGHTASPKALTATNGMPGIGTGKPTPQALAQAASKANQNIPPPKPKPTIPGLGTVMTVPQQPVGDGSHAKPGSATNPSPVNGLGTGMNTPHSTGGGDGSPKPVQQRYRPNYRITDPDKLAAMAEHRAMAGMGQVTDQHPANHANSTPTGGNHQPQANHVTPTQGHRKHYASTDTSGMDRHGNPIFNPSMASTGMGNGMPMHQPGNGMGNAMMGNHPGMGMGSMNHPGGNHPMGGGMGNGLPMHHAGNGMGNAMMGNHPGLGMSNGMPMHHPGNGMGMPQMGNMMPQHLSGGFGPMHGGGHTGGMHTGQMGGGHR